MKYAFTLPCYFKTQRISRVSKQVSSHDVDFSTCASFVFNVPQPKQSEYRGLDSW